MPLLICLFLILTACSDNLWYNQTTPHISIEVLTRSDTILVKDSVYFRAKINPSKDFVNKYYWIIDARNYSIPRLEFWEPFDSSGVYNAAFYALDSLGDTLSAGLTISVSYEPVCDNLTFKEVSDSLTIFKWHCYDKDNNALTYRFVLRDKDKNRNLINTTLQEDSIQHKNALPSDWEAHITATNSYGFKTQDSIWSEN
jgi:hypothetical protein